jgi:hypothetical protein
MRDGEDWVLSLVCERTSFSSSSSASDLLATAHHRNLPFRKRSTTRAYTTPHHTPRPQPLVCVCVNLQSLVTDGATLRTAAGFPSVRTASVLFEETFYNARDERCVTLESHYKRSIAGLPPLNVRACTQPCVPHTATA